MNREKRPWKNELKWTALSTAAVAFVTSLTCWPVVALGNTTPSDTSSAVQSEPLPTTISQEFSYLFPLDGPREYQKFASHVRQHKIKSPAHVSAEQDVAKIENQVNRLTEKLKTVRYRSPEYIATNENLIQLLEQKALVLESKTSGSNREQQVDEKVKTSVQVRSHQAQIYNDLLLALPLHPSARDWQLGILTARIRMGEPTAREEAMAFIQQSTVRETAHFRLLNYAAELDDGRILSSLDDLRELHAYFDQSAEKIIVKYIIAERLFISKDFKSSLREILDSLTLQRSILNQKTQPKLADLIRFMALRAIEMDLSLSCSAIVPLPNLLVELGLSDLKMGYLERCSLANAGKSLPLTLKGYVDILARKELDEQTRKQIEIRMLHLTLNSGETQMYFSAWQRVFNLSLHKDPQVANQVNPTLRLLHNQYKRSPSPIIARHVLQVNELFLRAFPPYAERVDHQLPNIEIIYDAGMHTDAVRMTEFVLSKTTDRFNRATALRININSRSLLMGLNPEKGVTSESKINADRESVNAIVKNIEQIQSLIPKPEATGYAHLAAQILMLSGEYNRALTKFDEAFAVTPEHPLASSSAQFLIKNLKSRKDEVHLEKFLRTFKNRGIIPSTDSRESVVSSLADTHLRNASRLFSQSKFEECGVKYADFAKEFPNHSNTALALERSGFCFFKALKIENSIAQYRQFLANFKGHVLTGEVHWMLGESLYKAKEFTPAAEQYIAFGRLQPEQGKIRKASLKAAESFVFAEKHKDALPHYEAYLATQTDRNERIKILTTIASAAESAKDNFAQLHALDRLRQLLTSSDELINVQFSMMKIFEQQKRDDQVHKIAKTILQYKTNTPSTLRQQAIAQFTLAKFELLGLREISIDVRKSPKGEIESLIQKFESLKERLTAPCAHNALESCVSGYFESSKLGWNIADVLDKLQLPNYFTPELIEEIKTLCEVKSDKLKIESTNLAVQLEETLRKPVNLPKSELEELEDYIKTSKSRMNDSSQTGSSAIE